MTRVWILTVAALLSAGCVMGKRAVIHDRRAPEGIWASGGWLVRGYAGRAMTRASDGVEQLPAQVAHPILVHLTPAGAHRRLRRALEHLLVAPQQGAQLTFELFSQQGPGLGAVQHDLVDHLVARRRIVGDLFVLADELQHLPPILRLQRRRKRRRIHGHNDHTHQ